MAFGLPLLPLFCDPRMPQANVMMSFNNFPAKESVPFLEELRSLGLSMGNLGSLGDNLSGLAKA